MKNPRLRRIACVLAALVLLVALGVAYVAYSISNVTEVAEAGMLRKLNGISSSFLRILQIRAKIQSSYDKMLMSNVRLSVLPLRELAKQDGGLDIRAYGSGFVLRTDGDNITLPRELANSSINAQCFRDASGNPLYTGSFHCAIDGSANDAYLCMFCSITDNYYYVDYTPTYERQEYVRSYVDITAILNQIETVLQGYVLLYVPDDGDNTLIFKSPFFEDCETLGETGINPNLPAGSFDTFTVNGTKCIYTLSAAESVPANVSYDHYRAVFAMPYDKATSLPPSRFIILLGVAALFFIVVISWILSVFALIRRGFVSESQRNQYGVVRVRRIIAGIGLVGALITVLTTMFSGALQLLYDKTMENQYLLNLMVAVDSQAKYDADIIKAHQEGIYVSHAQRIASLLHVHPQLRNQKTLDDMCLTIGADYLMLFDDRGDELLSNAPFVKLSLGDGMQYGGSDFRRLLKGMPSIVHDSVLDEATGLERQLIGVCMEDEDISDGYGALILARIPEDSKEEADVDILSVDEQLLSIFTKDSLCLFMDPETGKILHSDKHDYIGDNAQTLGLPDRALRDHFMDYFQFDNQRWYGCTTLANDRLYLCATRAGATYSHIFCNALIYGGMFAFAYALLAAVLLAGYTEANIAACEGIDTRAGHSPQDQTSSAGDLNATVISRVKLQVDAKHRHQSPERRAMFAFNVTLSVILFLLMAGMLVQRSNEHSFYLLSYVMGDGWAPGVNLFAFARIAITVVTTGLLLAGLNLVCALLCIILEKRGETICRLINSTLKYVAILVVLFTCFNYLGFDTRALLASVGILSLALSLGAKDLVADVLSGISIAFSDLYQIGDFIEIKDGGAPFKGWVLEIGVRTTTLINGDGHIKTMSNRDVKNVLNLSRRNCRYTIDITVGYDQSLQQVEEVLARELPKIGEGIDEIINGPTYQGVTGIGNGGLTLTISARCKEHNYGKVRTRLNREIRLMLEKSGIKIK